MQPDTFYPKRNTMIKKDIFNVFWTKVWEQIGVFQQKMWQYVKRLLGDFGTYSCMIPFLVFWNLVLSYGVYFDEFDIETSHGINDTEEGKAYDSNPGALLIMQESIPTIDQWEFCPAEIDSSPNLLGIVHTPTRRDMGWGGDRQGPAGTRTQNLSHTVRSLPALYDRIAIDTNFEKKNSLTRSSFIIQDILVICPRDRGT